MIRIMASEYNAPHSALEVYVSGCQRGCDGCHNPETWTFIEGRPWGRWLSANETKLNQPVVKQVWILGGDLLCQLNDYEISDLLSTFRRKLPGNKTLWLWTGAEIDKVQKAYLRWLDYVKTGPYKKELSGYKVQYDKAFPELELAGTNQKLWQIVMGKPKEVTA